MIVQAYNPVERGPAVWVQGPIESGTTTALVMRGIREYSGDGPLDLVVDSRGGCSAEGMRLYTALRELPRTKRITIIRASSMAAIVAMAGDVIRMLPGGSYFLHPVGFHGDAVAEMVTVKHVTADGLRKVAKRLDALDELHLDIIERRTGQPRESLRRLLANETTIDAEQAVALGFADEVIPAERVRC